MNETNTPAYATFDTFRKVVEFFAEASIPIVITDSTFDKYGKSQKWQLIGTFKFLGLTDEAGAATAKLQYLASSIPMRRSTFRGLISEAYKNVLNQIDPDTSRDVLDDIFQREFGVTGSTLKKSRTFFFKACEFAEISLPKKLNKITRKSSKTKTPKQSPQPATGNTPTEENISPLSAFVNTVHLRSGGTVTFSGEFDLVSLSKEDREWVFKLLDELKDYEKKGKEV